MHRPNFEAPACCASAGLGEYISGSILFEETLYDKAATGEPFVELMKKQGIIPGIKTDKVREVCVRCRPCGRQCPAVCMPRVSLRAGAASAQQPAAGQHLLVVLAGAVNQAGQALCPGLAIGVGQRHQTLPNKGSTVSTQR